MLRTTPHHPLTSKDNSAIKHIRSLSDARHRRKEKLFLIEGIKMVEEALRDDLGVTQVIATPSLTQHHGKGVLKLAESRHKEVLWVSDRLMDHLAESKTPQPVMAVVAMQERSGESLLADDRRLVVVAHQLQDPGNLGTIMRTAEAANASGLAIAPPSVDPYNPKAIRASMGSILRLPIANIAGIPAFLAACRERSFQIIATVLTGSTLPYAIDMKRPTVVILGQEGAGLPPALRETVDHEVRIPMAESIDSLNVATAGAVILYEAVRQRMK